MTYNNPKWVVTEFLRKNLTDPRASRRPTKKELTFTATAGQTDFILSYSTGKSLSYISKVKIDTVEIRKWKDYSIDFRDNKVILKTGATLGQTIEIELYESSTNWIYWDTLQENLNPLNFPRISIIVGAGSGSRLGNYEAPVESSISLQFDVYTKEKSTTQIFEIDGKNYTGEELAERIAYDIQRAFEDKIDELHPVLYDYIPSSFPPRYIPFDETFQCHRKIVECNLRGVTLGEY